jgi:small-conductance mechanosensitive channel
MGHVLNLSQHALNVLIVLAVGIVGGLVLHWILFKILQRLARRTGTVLDDSIAQHCRGASRLLVLLLVLQICLPLLSLPAGLESFVPQLTGILLIISVAWLVISFTDVGRDLLAIRFDVNAPDNLYARKIHTQYDVLRKVVIAVTIVLALASILMTFEKVRQLGAGILASAGIAGIIIGFAAQKSLGTLLAGIQIAIAQPIRLDDVVIVEGEWGRIEEITLTYVVVRIWDQRRLVVPITYFLDKPFQNWTRVSAELLGTIYLYVDYTIPLEALRQELQRIVEADERWDRRVVGMVVTNVTERTVELRALVSAADSGRAWDLRCHVREKLVEFVRDNYPQTLPRLRAELSELPGTHIDRGGRAG